MDEAGARRREQRDACLLGASTSPPKVARGTEGIQTGQTPEHLAPPHLLGRTTLDVALRCRDQPKRHSEEHSGPDLLSGRVFSELLLRSRHTKNLPAGASFCGRRETVHQTPGFRAVRASRHLRTPLALWTNLDSAGRWPGDASFATAKRASRASEPGRVLVVPSASKAQRY